MSDYARDRTWRAYDELTVTVPAAMPRSHYTPPVQPWTRDELEAALDAVIDQLDDLLDRNDYAAAVALDAQADELAARLARMCDSGSAR